MVDASSASPAPVQDGEPRVRLLIIDDVFDNRAVLGRRFERRGFEVSEADSGTRGLEMIASESFDIVLLDWMMPDLEGIEVLRRIRETHSDVALPVIMVTAKTQSEDIVQALGAGANDYITKPVDFAVALARVQTQVGRKRAEEKVLAANEALSRANEGLEQLVAERTGELRVAMEEAQAANRSKDAFLATMSHELRTPLNGVIGMAQVLTGTSLTPQQLQMVDVINSSAEGLQGIVADLLDIVDITSGRLELAPQPICLGDVVREAAVVAQRHAAERGIAFRLELAPDAEGEVRADPVRLRQVLSHLLSNAVKFTEKGEIAFTVARDGDRVSITVRDTGVGFDPAATERLFRPFEQADGSLTRRFGGVGMGLAICREVVTRMGGAITAEGRPGEGATFRLDLPLPHQGRAASSPSGAQARALKVLCVEDHPINRKVVELIMAAAGIDLRSVENGVLAVEAFQSERFDVVLMDMQMPVMDGLTATRAIRALEGADGRPRTPLVMVTAHGFPEHVNASRAAGADRHLTKPVNAAELVSAIHEVVAEATQEQALSA
jgi:signal transduction histidine kinase